jgi:NitT/TauT family transport system substrate-binding protein
MKRKTTIYIIAVFIVFIFTIPATGSEKIIYSLNWTPQAQHVPFFAALGSGLYEGEGLDVDIQKGNGSSKTIQRVAIGDATFGLASAINLVKAKAKDIDNVIMIGTVFSNSPQLLVSLKENNFTSPKDVASKKVATTAWAALRNVLPIFCERNNTPKTFEFVLMDSGVIFQSVMSGKVQFGDNYLPNLPTWQKLAKEQNKELNVMKFADYGVNHYDLMIIGNTEYLKKHPNIAKKFLRATYKGYELTRNNPEKAVDYYLKYNPILGKDTTIAGLPPTFELLEDEYTRKNGVGYIDPAKVTDTIELIRKSYNIEKAIRADSLFSNEYLK